MQIAQQDFVAIRLARGGGGIEFITIRGAVLGADIVQSHIHRDTLGQGIRPRRAQPGFIILAHSAVEERRGFHRGPGFFRPGRHRQSETSEQPQMLHGHDLPWITRSMQPASSAVKVNVRDNIFSKGWKNENALFPRVGTFSPVDRLEAWPQAPLAFFVIFCSKNAYGRVQASRRLMMILVGLRRGSTVVAGRLAGASSAAGSRAIWAPSGAAPLSSCRSSTSSTISRRMVV